MKNNIFIKIIILFLSLLLLSSCNKDGKDAQSLNLKDIYTMESIKTDISGLKLKNNSDGYKESEKYNFRELENILNIEFLKSNLFMNDSYYVKYYETNTVSNILFVSNDTVEEKSPYLTQVLSKKPTLNIEWFNNDIQKSLDTELMGNVVKEEKYNLNGTEILIISSTTNNTKNYTAIFKHNNKVYTIGKTDNIEDIKKMVATFNLN